LRAFLDFLGGQPEAMNAHPGGMPVTQHLRNAEAPATCSVEGYTQDPSRSLNGDDGLGETYGTGKYWKCARPAWRIGGYEPTAVKKSKRI